ncbi:hypothetical protein KIPB_016947 [Kipferlia bialata]|uniref:Uncharacterized protein n=1 Tax=Kipferlia bialata TaxID=797122 RepID=A0A391PF88_9EUKA|nr:hypothetical protein KIPB_016947 [Kipferlia bialata]|eukprot:g16947.t1
MGSSLEGAQAELAAVTKQAALVRQRGTDSFIELSGDFRASGAIPPDMQFERPQYAEWAHIYIDVVCIRTIRIL